MKIKRLNIFVFGIFIFAIFSNIFSQNLAQNAPSSRSFELSFGQSVLFISNSDQLDLLKNSAIVIPTSSILFFVELRTLKKIRIPLFFNLPLGTKQFLINNQLMVENASSSYGAGLQFKIFKLKIHEKSAIEMELGPLASFGKDNKGNMWFAPLFASRLRVMKGENFVMYIGGSYAFGVNALGLLYGTGTIF